MPTITEMKTQLKKFCKLCDVDEDIQKKWLDYFDNISSSPITDTLISLVAQHSTNISKLTQILIEVNPELEEKYNSQEKPVIIAHPTDPTLLRVYENLIILSSKDEDHKDISIFEASRVFKTFLAQHEEDMKGPGKQKWESEERILKRLNSFIDMPTARVLSRYTNFDKLFPPEVSTVIRDFATAIDIARKPMELLYADTPEDFCTMYGTGPSSCMTLNGGNSQKFSWMWKNKFCPASFYAYFPYTRGVYMMKGGKVVARTILYRDQEKENVWYYGRTYETAGEVGRKFITSLEAYGYKSLTKTAQYQAHSVYFVKDGTTFIIPGVPHTKPGVFCMPWPYFDNLDYHGKGFYASWDAEKKEFVITFNNKKNNSEDMLPVQNQNGMLLSIDYSERKCEHCNKMHKDRNFPWFVSHDGHVFDQLECMLAAGYVRVKTNQAEIYQLPEASLIPIFGLSNTVFFSTHKVAENNGYYTMINDDGSVPEEGDIQVTNAYASNMIIKDHVYVSKKQTFPTRNGSIQLEFNTSIKNVTLEIEEEEWANFESNRIIPIIPQMGHEDIVVEHP